MVSGIDTRVTDSRWPTRASVARLSGGAALVGIALTVLIFGALHLLPPTRDISPVHRTISEYALTDSAWAFNLAVILLAFSSVAAFAGLVLVRRVSALSAATVFATFWIAGLLTLVSFPKHNWALGSIGNTGQIHRLASLVAFVALPIAVMAAARRRQDRASRPAARWAFWLGAASLLWFLPMLWAIATAPTAWWEAIPLGLIERGLALTEVLALVTLAVLVRTAARQSPGLVSESRT